jgi:hypothetical protein
MTFDQWFETVIPELHCSPAFIYRVDMMKTLLRSAYDGGYSAAMREVLVGQMDARQEHAESEQLHIKNMKSLV